MILDWKLARYRYAGASYWTRGYYAGLAGLAAPMEPEASLAERSRSIIVPWIEIDLETNPQYLSPVGRAVPDPASYHGGFKNDLVREWGVFRRALSGPDGEYVSSTFESSLSDQSRALRGLPDVFKGRTARVYAIDHASRRLQKRPRLIARAVLQSPQWTRNLTVQLSGEDPLTSRLGSVTFAENIPPDIITRHQFGLVDDHPSLGKAVPRIYGDYSQPKNGDGRVPVIPLGTMMLANMPLSTPPAAWGMGLVSKFACKEISGLYVGGESKDIIGSSSSVLFVVPGQYRWVNSINPLLGANMTIPIGNGNYTIIFIWAGSSIWDQFLDGSVTFTVTCKGKDAYGTGLGPLLTTPAMQLLDLLKNDVMDSQQTSPLGIPLWPDTNEPMINESSFAVADAKGAAMYPGGFVSAAYLGTQRRTSTVIGEFCRSGGFENGWIRNQEFAAIMFDTADEATLQFKPSAGDIIIKNSVEVIPDDSEHWNYVEFGYGEDGISAGLAIDHAHVRDADSIAPARYGQVYRSPKFVFPFTHDGDMARVLATHILKQHTDPPNLVPLDTDLVGQDLDLGSVVGVTAKGGPTSTGWTEHACQVRVIEAHLNQLMTRFQLRDHEQVPASIPSLALVIISLTRSGSTATAEVTGHPFQTGDVGVVSGVTQVEYNGEYAFTRVDADHFSWTVTGTPTTPATGTMRVGTYSNGEPAVVDEPVVVTDRPTRTGPIPGGELELDGGGDPDTPITWTAYATIPRGKRFRVNKERVGKRVLKFHQYRKTNGAGTSVRLRVVHIGTGDEIVEGPAENTLSWNYFVSTIDPSLWKEGEEEYEIQGRRTNSSFLVYGYGHVGVHA